MYIRKEKSKDCRIKSLQKNKVRSGSITLEAAYLVPIAAVTIALVLGFIFFTYERAAAKAIAYETCFYAVQAFDEKLSDEGLLHRLYDRAEELTTGKGVFDYKIIRSASDIKLLISLELMTEIFGNIFVSSETIRITEQDVVKVKRKLWNFKYGQNNKE